MQSAAALDPRAWVLPFDLKGTGDLSALEPVAYRYRAGDDDEDIAYGLAAMREMRAELRRRTKVIPRLLDEKSAMKLVFATLIRASDRWSRVSVSELERQQLIMLRRELGLEGPEFGPARSTYPVNS